MLTKMGTLELITSMMELFLFLKDAPNRQKYFGRFATLKESLLWQVRTKEGAKELTQDGHAAGLLDENTVVAASTVRGGENGGLCGGLNDPRVVPKQAALDRLLEAPEQDRDPVLIQAAEEALREAIAARDSTSKAKSKAGACGGDEDYRVDEAQAEQEKLLEEPMINDVAIKVAEEKIELALAKKEKTRVGKSKGGIKAGLSGGKNDPRPLEAQAVVEELFNAPEIDEDAIVAAKEAHKNAIEMQQKASKGKSEGGKKSGKKNGKYIPY